MKTPPNEFKVALQAREELIGLWLSLANPYTAEMCAGAGFDWLLIDGEHSPNDTRSILGQLQAIAAGGGSAAVARVPSGDTVTIKQFLDLGVRNLLVPMVDTAEQARDIVSATRYAPAGVRGMAGARASRWGRFTDYPQVANNHICVLLQIESLAGLANLEAIAAIDGVDGIFIGPGDLSASMGHPGNAAHPEVAKTIESAIARIVAAGKAPGILTPDPVLARRYLELGARFVAVGLDTALLMRGVNALAGEFGRSAGARTAAGDVYS